MFLAPWTQPTMQRPHRLAAGAVGALAAEVGVGDRLAGLAEVDADGGVFVGVADAELLAELAQELVGGVVVRVLDHAEHPLRLGVVGRQRRLPVVASRPTGGPRRTARGGT